jgi:hypothetical protein
MCIRRFFDQSEFCLPSKAPQFLLAPVTVVDTAAAGKPQNEKPRTSGGDGGDESSSEWARRRVPVYGRVNARPLAPEGRPPADER